MPRIVECGAAAGQTPRLPSIMIHGRGRDAGEEMAALAGSARRRRHPLLLSRGAGAAAGIPQRFIESARSANQPALDASRSATVEALLARTSDGRGFADERIVLCGFSQGGCLAAQTLLRRPSAYAAAHPVHRRSDRAARHDLDARRRRLTGRAGPAHRLARPTSGFRPGARRETGRRAFGPRRAAGDGDLSRAAPHIVCDDEIVRARAMLERAVKIAARS